MTPEMTLQDWFAGQIMAAMIGSDPANSNHRDVNGRLCGMEPARMENMVKNAYQAAEAMMKHRATLTPTRTTHAAPRTSINLDAPRPTPRV